MLANERECLYKSANNFSKIAHLFRHQLGLSLFNRRMSKGISGFPVEVRTPKIANLQSASSLLPYPLNIPSQASAPRLTFLDSISFLPQVSTAIFSFLYLN